MARISVHNNRIIVHDIDLGASFADLRADIAVDKVGRVQVLAERMRFYCDLDSMRNDVLGAIGDFLKQDEGYGKVFGNLKRKVDRLLAKRVG